jgi:hypothetical protein
MYEEEEEEKTHIRIQTMISFLFVFTDDPKRRRERLVNEQNDSRTNK